MSTIPNILATQKAALEDFLAVQNTFFQGFEKWVDLNLKAARVSLDEAAEKTQGAAQLKDVQETLAFTSGLVQPTAEKAVAYSKQVYDIVSGVQADLGKLAEAQVARSQQQFADVVEQFSKNVPAGSEGAVSLLKSSLATANSAYASLAKAAKQATDAAESNLNAATKATFKVASDAAAAARPATRGNRRASAVAA